MAKKNRVRVTPKSVGSPKVNGKSSQMVDDLKDVGSGLMSDVIIPAFKNMLYDFITSGSSQMIFHDDRGVRRNAQSNHRDYSSISNNMNSPTKASLSSSRRSKTRRNMVRDIVLNTRQDAMDIIDELSENIEHYGFTTVADYYECCSYSGAPQDNNYGWDRAAFRGVRIIASGGGYVIDLPRPIPFD